MSSDLLAHMILLTRYINRNKEYYDKIITLHIFKISLNAISNTHSIINQAICNIRNIIYEHIRKPILTRQFVLSHILVKHNVMINDANVNLVVRAFIHHFLH